jgi:hypothetical protein
MKPAASHTAAAAPTQAVDRAYCEGPSFASGTRYMATLLALSLVVLAWRNADHPLVAMLSTQATVYVLIAVAIVASGYWNVLYSRTYIDATHIRQGCWPVQRSVALADIVQLKLIRAPRFQAWVTPRLLVRTRSSGKSTFYCADARVLQAVEELAYGPAEQRSRG